MEVSRSCRLAIEVFKTLKPLNPDFMHMTYFKKSSYSARRKNDLVVNRAKTTTFGGKSLRTLGPKIWNSLPEDIKDLTSTPKFTEFIKTWYGPNADATYANTRVTHITILELRTLFEHVLVEISYPISIKRNETAVF